MFLYFYFQGVLSVTIALNFVFEHNVLCSEVVALDLGWFIS